MTTRNHEPCHTSLLTSHLSEAGKSLLTRVATDVPTIVKAWVDSGYKAAAAEHGATSAAARPTKAP